MNETQTTARRPGRPKVSKNKLNDLQQVNGKDKSSPKAEPTTLAQIWGEDGTEKYGTLVAEEYEKRINSMSRMDLFTHSARFSVTPSDNLPALRKKLMSEFYKHAVKFKSKSQSSTTIRGSSTAKVKGPVSLDEILNGAK